MMDPEARAEELTQQLISEVDPRVLDRVLVLLEKALRRLSIQMILATDIGDRP
jgi:hypothetical protein